jgi:hypothetical protein
MATYRVTLQVSSSMLSTLLSIVEDNRDIALMSVSSASDPAPLPPSPPPPVRTLQNEAPRTRFIDGKNNKRMRADELIAETLRSGPASLEDLRHVFVNADFAAASAAPTVSRMLRNGRIHRGLHGRYALNSDGDARATSSRALAGGGTL